MSRRPKSLLIPLAAQGGKPIHQLSNAAARTVLEGLQSQPLDKLPAVTEEGTIPGGPIESGFATDPAPGEGHRQAPVIMYFHGSGWILGSKNTHDRLVHEIAQGANAVMVLVNYTPSPEAKFSVPSKAAYAASNYCAAPGEPWPALRTRHRFLRSRKPANREAWQIPG